MGCDIHGPFIEYRAYEAGSVNGEIWYGIAVLDGDRDYRAFGLMAGVRDRVDPVVPTDRGYPPNMDYAAREHAKDGVCDCHSATWLDLTEMRRVAEAYALDPGYESTPSFIHSCIALMGDSEARSGKPTRAIFCFDN